MIKNMSKTLLRIGRMLVDQDEAEILIEPQLREEGFWFGGGDICRDATGALWLVGRYRNGGDSRVGLEAGPRGAELALFRSEDDGETFERQFSFLKEDLAPRGEEVLSIEGASLHVTQEGVQLYVSSEKKRDYPEDVSKYQKPGTGIWSIDVMRADDFSELQDARISPALHSDNPATLHVKDPQIYRLNGRTIMLYCTHPFTWASSNTGYAVENGSEWENCCTSLISRGACWDVAICRVTDRMQLPQVGILENQPPLSLYFYDGGECMNDHESAKPRGYSCEEIGGLAAGRDDEFPQIERLSPLRPCFVSPHGTGSSRYVKVFDTDSHYLVTWQQSNPDYSQPLVVNRVPKERVEAILQR